MKTIFAIALILASTTATAQAGSIKIPRQFHGAWCPNAELTEYKRSRCNDPIRVHATGYSYGKGGKCRIYAGALEDPEAEFIRIDEETLLISFVCSLPEEGWNDLCFQLKSRRITTAGRCSKQD